MFDEEKAKRTVDFINCLKHTKGKWRGQPFELLPWQEAIMGSPAQGAPAMWTALHLLPTTGNITLQRLRQG